MLPLAVPYNLMSARHYDVDVSKESSSSTAMQGNSSNESAIFNNVKQQEIHAEMSVGFLGKGSDQKLGLQIIQTASRSGCTNTEGLTFIPRTEMRIAETRLCYGH